MDANRFFSVPYDNRNDTTIRRMKKRMGGIVAYGRWISLLGIMYDENGLLDMNDTAMREIVAEELELEDVDQYFHDLINLGLIEAEPYHDHNYVMNDGVCDELDYRRTKAEAGRKSGQARRAKAREQKAEQENEQNI